MRIDLQKGRYQVRLAADDADVVACQRLRQRCFFGTDGLDADRFDPTWSHLMVVDQGHGAVVCTLRFCLMRGQAVGQGYTAAFYDLSGFVQTPGLLMEIGRFCTDPAHPDPHILRVAWGGLTRIVDREGVGLVFGCTSFDGTDAGPYTQVFQRLAAHFLAPAHFGSFAKSGDVVPLDSLRSASAPQNPMPPLLRTYLAMGGWVSNHAVRDDQMGTLHVLTALEIDKVPPARAKALRALA